MPRDSLAQFQASNAKLNNSATNSSHQHRKARRDEQGCSNASHSKTPYSLHKTLACTSNTSENQRRQRRRLYAILKVARSMRGNTIHPPPPSPSRRPAESVVQWANRAESLDEEGEQIGAAPGTSTTAVADLWTVRASACTPWRYPPCGPAPKLELACPISAEPFRRCGGPLNNLQDSKSFLTKKTTPLRVPSIFSSPAAPSPRRPNQPY